MLDFRPFSLEMIHMTHSIPDSSAVALGTDLGTVLITGDYKFDQTPVNGAPADVSRLAELGRGGRAALLRGFDQRRPRGLLAFGVAESDRTRRRRSPAVQGRIIVTSFASNIHRVQQVIDAATALEPQGGAGGTLDAQERRASDARSATSMCPRASS